MNPSCENMLSLQQVEMAEKDSDDSAGHFPFAHTLRLYLYHYGSVHYTQHVLRHATCPTRWHQQLSEHSSPHV